MRAPDFLKAGLGHMQDRATTYDKPQGERSMGMTVALANVLLAEKLREPLSEEDGWNFMELLKLVRSKQGEFKADNYEDRAAYAGLAGEAAFQERARQQPLPRGEFAPGAPISATTAPPAAPDVSVLFNALKTAANRMDRLALDAQPEMRAWATEWAEEARSALSAHREQQGGEV